MANKAAAEAKKALAEKKASEAARLEAAALFNPAAAQQKVPFGVDPKTILCEFHRKGLCTKGKKCKFSHDLDIGRKATKRDLYTDDRDKKEEDTMDKWDEEKLRSVISSKHGNPIVTTDIVCKFFIEAVENGKYGWFWTCPGGGNDCKYRHSLPPGFVLKTKEQKRLEKMADESKPKITLEDFIETARDQLPKGNLTPITWKSFVKWKQEHREKRLNEKSKNKKALTGKEVILKKFADKFYEEEENADQGTAWDLSDFKNALKDDDKDENVMDYGDGSNAFGAEQEGPGEAEASEVPNETREEIKETTEEFKESVEIKAEAPAAEVAN
ncbi:hypothetical protein BABINDRAFT_162894 [Babjeviella inositovora NRRL Y-12698]|uniref:C3H1-type domain-containing protein n=1 Tax=Babjeviella inositovora NRRL Y-12698 TaxID=984486 RepID=A0A1E3QKP9_9ASCO|nr:uncharacterized protein BABINDRAFT_162894 [Babjeviella inositovora NRRL Y-12698]ODQ78230.1 hypothetical protein BABINDRAFT_162894 [Babjeviella inositovora NRRL Y-12698]